MKLSDIVFASGRVWIFTLVGITVAVYIWFFSDTTDRLAISGWAVTIGYLVGWLVSMLPTKKTE